MTSQQGSLSEVGRNIRTLARRKQIGFAQAARRIKFQDQSVEAALDLALEQYERQPSPKLLETIGDLYVSAGQQVVAESIFKAMFHEGASLHVTNMIFAGLPATRALVDQKKKILYIPIPKCGSTSVKNYFTAATYGKIYGETVHFRHGELYRTVTPVQMTTTYKDYFRFSVVRDPISRVVSYFSRNVASGSLSREGFQQEEFRDYPLKPTALQFAQYFHQYRQIFKDARHHTDHIGGYLEPFRASLDKVYKISELPQIRDYLSKAYGCTLEDERSMVSKADSTETEKCREIMERLADWYRPDYDAYF